MYEDAVYQDVVTDEDAAYAEDLTYESVSEVVPVPPVPAGARRRHRDRPANNPG
ncbi:hypothetical protein H7H37_26550 [Mycolicibacterium insubricum]|nr:hypothetical protein [Mycolicibacterium insubricum]